MQRISGVHRLEIYNVGYESGDSVEYSFYDKYGKQIHKLFVGNLEEFSGAGEFKNINKVETTNDTVIITFDGDVSCRIEKSDIEIKITCEK